LLVTIEEWRLMIMKNNKDKEYKYKVSTFTHNGKQYKCYGNTQKEADQKAVLKKKSLESGEVGISGNMTAVQYCYEWVETYKKGKVIEKSYIDCIRFIKRQIAPELGSTLLKNVRDIHLQKILNNRAGYSKSNVTKLYQLIKAVFKQARISRLIPYDPAEELKMPGTSTKPKRRSITDSERKYLLMTAENHKMGLLLRTILGTGLRPGEIIALDAIDIDVKNKMIKVNKAKEAGSNEIKDPKTEAGFREVPIPDDLISDLTTAIKGKRPNDPAFTQATNNNRHTVSSFYKTWDSFKREMDILMGARTVVIRKKIIKGKPQVTKNIRTVETHGFKGALQGSIMNKERDGKNGSVIDPNLCPYYLRHTYCTDLQDAGVTLNVARYLMGHEDISVTAQIYTKTTKKVIADAAVKINALHKAVNM